MGSVFKPMVTRPLPAGAKLVTRAGKPVAVWVDDAGKKRTAAATGSRAKRPGIVERASTYTAKYRDADGVVRRVPTGCRTLDAARAVLAELEARAEKVKSGVLTQAESNVADHASSPVTEHTEAYIVHLARKRGRGAHRTTAKGHVENVERDLKAAVAECGFKRLRDLNRDAVAAWVSRLLELPDEPVVDAAGNVLTPRRPAARTINAKLGTLTSWGNWLVESGRLVVNPFDRLCKSAGVDESDDIRRKRRALTADELRRLLVVARLRPVAEYGRATVKVIDVDRAAKSRSTWKKAGLTFDTLADAAERGRATLRGRPDVIERLERLGQERALLYAVLVTTGLRRGELAAITVGDVLLDDERPVIRLRGADAKNGEPATFRLRPDVADELRAWIETQAEAVCQQRIGVAGVIHAGLPADTPLFDVPDKLVRILDRDCMAAGIPKRDDRGRTVDVHALRGTLASHLARAGVDPVTLKTIMRHARLETTLTHYTDPRLLDVDRAIDALPALLGGPVGTESHRATGTDDARAVVPTVVPTAGRRGRTLSNRDNCVDDVDCGVVDATALPATDSATKAGELKGWLTGLEPATPRITI
jgi:integrase